MLLVDEMLFCKENIYVMRSFYDEFIIKVINIKCNENDIK